MEKQILIDKIKDLQICHKQNFVVTNKISKDPNLLEPVLKHTSFIDYMNPTLGQRIYALLGNLNKCICGNFLNFYGTTLITPNTCGDKKCIKIKTEATNIERYGTANVFASSIIKDRIKESNIEKYGVENPMQNKDVQDKGKATNLEKYGSENVFASEEIKDKIKQTHVERYGVEYPQQSPEIKAKSDETLFKNYGVTGSPFNSKEIVKNIQIGFNEKYGCHPRSTKEVQDKCKATNQRIYGCDNPMQNSEIFSKQTKSSYSSAEYTLPSGKIVNVMGYEPRALDILLQTYKEEDILIVSSDIEEKIGKILYIVENEKTYRYFPDFYIISENRIIEVKSTWTYLKDKSDNLLKQQACLDLGFNYDFMVFDDKKLLTNDEVLNLHK